MNTIASSFILCEGYEYYHYYSGTHFLSYKQRPCLQLRFFIILTISSSSCKMLCIYLCFLTCYYIFTYNATNTKCKKLSKQSLSKHFADSSLWSKFYGNEVVCNTSIDALHVISCPISNHDCRRHGLMK